MAKILFGGSQEPERGRPNMIHNDLIEKLERGGHEVKYVSRGDDMLGELASKQMPFKPYSYDLVIYDTRLFYPCDKIDSIEKRVKKRVEMFKERVVYYLKLAKAPVIVIADEEIKEEIWPIVAGAGFNQYSQFYSVDKFTELVEILSKNN